MKHLKPRLERGVKLIPVAPCSGRSHAPLRPRQAIALYSLVSSIFLDLFSISYPTLPYPYLTLPYLPFNDIQLSYLDKFYDIPVNIFCSVSGKTKHLITHDKGRQSLTRQSMPAHDKSFLGVNIEKIRQHSFSGPVSSHDRAPVVSFEGKAPALAESGVIFTDEEHALLISFIESATSLTKWIKILAISYPLEVNLYTLAANTDKCLENIHPNGKILEGPNLRIEFSKLVNALKELYEESCCLLRDKGHKLKLREDLENKLCVALTNAEMELKKCAIYDTPKGSLVYLQHLQEEQVSFVCCDSYNLFVTLYFCI